ncbi:alpha-glucan family phosphorylase [Arcobacter sp. FWKO B]|uniref:alpha-glucan family phosphorylase n=1 Tax=Arcobacter sp. FWKO B TaxID=2593672 RepID=UPI0018A38667|nr:alpha-glucan family phosphorylase [Arcobacter sp. FWKO B]QOG11465.1 alpha-glucan family phosphorylase [Arcobacter sp. FWKO B]
MSNFIEYNINEKYKTSVAYFSMEFAIHQALKIYSGGLGFLAGSHMRSAYDLGQNVLGIGILWSFGYYDQARDEDRNLKVEFRRKRYFFLQDLGISVDVVINAKVVKVKAFLVPCETFNTAPIILLSTDTEENDYLSRTITHKLYDANEEARIAQEIVLGIGGAKVLEALHIKPKIYHMNEGHALPLVFELRNKHKNFDEMKKKIVFTTHTPEAAGNEEHSLALLYKMGFFASLSIEEVQTFMGSTSDTFSLTVGALKAAKISNGVSKLHSKVACKMWSHVENKCDIVHITNAQNRRYWVDKGLLKALDEHEDYELEARKKHLKRILFDEVANQTGKMFDPNILTIVWARRFAEYKRPGLLKYDFQKFLELVNRKDMPVQIIWAGKPYPFDNGAINIFNEISYISKHLKNVAVMIGYELNLSKMLKKGADIWLNTPRITKEASGTSGMSAAMNGAINLSTLDGWHPEFEKHGVNSFTIPAVDENLPIEEQDILDNKALMDILLDEVIPMYYQDNTKWMNIMKNSMLDTLNAFDSGRMAHEYYVKMYDV